METIWCYTENPNKEWDYCDPITDEEIKRQNDAYSSIRRFAWEGKWKSITVDLVDVDKVKESHTIEYSSSLSPFFHYDTYPWNGQYHESYDRLMSIYQLHYGYLDLYEMIFTMNSGESSELLPSRFPKSPNPYQVETIGIND